MTMQPDATAAPAADTAAATAADTTTAAASATADAPKRTPWQAVSEWLQRLIEQPLKLITVIVACTLLVWLFGGISVARQWLLVEYFNFGKLDNLENTFAPVNAFFTGISGIGLIFTICLQILGMRRLKKDSEDNQKLLNDQLNHAKVESQASQDLLNKQLEQAKSEFITNRTESFFFELLKIHRENSSSLKNKSSDAKSIVEGVKSDYIELQTHIIIPKFDFTKSISSVGQTIFQNKAYAEFKVYEYPKNFTTYEYVTMNAYGVHYSRNKKQLSSYFRHLYHTIKYVSTAATDEQSRKWYMQLIRAQLDTYEQALLLYNAYFYYLINRKTHDASGNLVSNEENARAFMTLIEKHHLLHEMDKSLLTHPSLEAAYDKSAFNTPSPTEEPSHGDANA